MQEVDSTKFLEALKTGKFDPEQIYPIPMLDIYPDDSFNSRGTIQPLTVLELAKEIAQNGLIQPITVQPFNLIPGKRFRIVAGYRRYRAHEVNGATTIRSTIRIGLSDLDARLINLIENTQREQLNIMQEARAIEFFKLAGWTQDDVGRKLGKSRGWAQTRFYLLDLPKEAQDEAESGMINGSDIHELWRASAFGYNVQIELLKDIKDRKGRGKKLQAKADKTAGAVKKVRGVDAIFEFQEIIQETMGNPADFAAKCLAWTVGEIDDAEVHYALQDHAFLHGKKYTVPEGYKNKQLEEVA